MLFRGRADESGHYLWPFHLSTPSLHSCLGVVRGDFPALFPLVAVFVQLFSVNLSNPLELLPSSLIPFGIECQVFYYLPDKEIFLCALSC